MIKEKDLGKGRFFTTNGKDVWKLEEIVRRPRLELRNMETADVEFVTPGTETAEQFYPIKMPEIKPAVFGRKKKKTPTVPKKALKPKAPSVKKLGAKRKKTSQYLGVSWDKKSGRWRAQLSRQGKYRFFGVFKIEELAAAAVQDHLGNKIEATRLRKIVEQKKAIKELKQEAEPFYQCSGCGQDYQQEPEKCLKCGGGSFERIAVNR